MDNNKINEGELTKRIKTLVLQERYEEALKALEDVDVNRIKNVSILCLAGEVYMGLDRYDEAESILLRVYEKNPNTRRILDLLTTLYIDKGEYSEAEYYYKEFIGVASRDLHRYILRYRLDRGKGERLSVLIDTLEKLKDYEYIEEWAYELATLYEASGETKKCIHECDEIVLWFGHGEYVDKAIALKCKLTGEPLPEISTEEQYEREEGLAANSGVDSGIPVNDYEGSIDVELIQRALDETNESSVDDEQTKQSAKIATKSEEEDEESLLDETIADGDMPEKAEIFENTDEGDEKSSIAQLFSNLMFGRNKEKDKHYDWSAMSIDEEKEMVSASSSLNEIGDDGLLPETDMKMIPDDDDDDDGDEIIDDIDFSVAAIFEGSGDESLFPEIDENADGTNLLKDVNEDAESNGSDVKETTDADIKADNDMVEDDTGEDEMAADDITDDDMDDDMGDEDEISDDILASDTVMDIFGSVVGVKSIKSQLAKTFTRFEDSTLDSMDLLAPYDINFVVTGYDMSAKSQIAIGIAKALNTYGVCDKNKLVRAKADDLNRRDFSMIFDKLKGGCLIIENVGELNDRAAEIIADYVQKDNQEVAIVLEGEEDQIKLLFKKYPALHAKFLNIIHIGKYNENELVQLATGYAKKKGYELSKSAGTALKRLLRERMQDGCSVNYEDIMAIIEEAIASLEKRNMKNLFMTVLDNKYEEAAMFMLQPEDFDNINIPE